MTDAEIITFVRFWLGGLTENTVTDDILLLLIHQVRTQYPTATDCQLKFYTVKVLLEWLIRSEAQGSSSTVGGGDLKRRKEKIGKREIEVEYHAGGTTTTKSSWQSVLDNLLDDPDSIGCDVFPDNNTGDTTEGGSGTVRIGVTKDRFETAAPWRSNRRINTFYDDL